MNSLKGQLLIATPELDAPFFARTVILMVEHGPGGAVGLVLNKPTEATVADIAGAVLHAESDWDKPIQVGGPVDGPLMAIHGVEALSDAEVIPGIYTSVDAEKVRQVLTRRIEPSMIVANYAGWGPGQLEGEFDSDSWRTLPASPSLVFWDDARDLWEVVVSAAETRSLAAFLRLGVVPSDPSVN